MNFSRIVHEEIRAKKDFQITAQRSDQNQEKDKKKESVGSKTQIFGEVLQQHPSTKIGPKPRKRQKKESVGSKTQNFGEVLHQHPIPISPHP